MMEKIRKKDIRRKRIGLIALAVLLLIAGRIWKVNHSQSIKKYMADVMVYDVGSEIALPDASYYWDAADLEGYHMCVTETEIVNTESFLARYDMTLEELKELSADEAASFDDEKLVYMVTVKFWNTKWNEESDVTILLDNFVLIGSDFYVLPATNSINRIVGFNSELNGASSFSIQSDRVFEVVLPYLIDTESETAVSLDDLLDSELKLLITVYPEELYLKLPSPGTGE